MIMKEVMREVSRRVTLSDLAEDASRSIDAYREKKIDGKVLFGRLNVDSVRGSFRLFGDVMTILGVRAVMDDMSPSYLLYGAAATAITYAADYFIFEKYSGKPL